MKSLLFVGLFLVSAAVLTQCTKRDNAINPAQPNPAGERLAYGDSTFYLKSSGEKYTISPLGNRTGKYSAVPSNLKIDENTGKISIEPNGLDNTSQTGLWYKILFTPTRAGATDSTMVMISGVNYVDAFYKYDKNGIGDTIIAPIYNARLNERMPKGRFWIEEKAYENIIDPTSGNININKFFKVARQARSANSDSSWETLTVRYRLEDKSYNAENHIEILLYHYYIPVNDVPRNVTLAMNEHRLQTFGLNLPLLTATKGADENLPNLLFSSTALGKSLKPRPPCVVIVGN